MAVGSTCDKSVGKGDKARALELREEQVIIRRRSERKREAFSSALLRNVWVGWVVRVRINGKGERELSEIHKNKERFRERERAREWYKSRGRKRANRR